MVDDYRPTEPVNVYEAVDPPPEHIWKDQAAEPVRPERTWKDNPLLWIVVVVLVFMAVPFLANMATRAPKTAQKPAAEAASAPLLTSEPTDAGAATPQHNAPAVVADRPAPLPARAPADPARQMVTKCVENGRVVYTQTGQCAGSVTAVPIDPGKNVVGPGERPARPSP